MGGRSIGEGQRTATGFQGAWQSRSLQSRKTIPLGPATRESRGGEARKEESDHPGASVHIPRKSRKQGKRRIKRKNLYSLCAPKTRSGKKKKPGSQLRIGRKNAEERTIPLSPRKKICAGSRDQKPTRKQTGLKYWKRRKHRKASTFIRKRGTAR